MHEEQTLQAFFSFWYSQPIFSAGELCRHIIADRLASGRARIWPLAGISLGHFPMYIPKYEAHSILRRDGFLFRLHNDSNKPLHLLTSAQIRLHETKEDRVMGRHCLTIEHVLGCGFVKELNLSGIETQPSLAA